MTAHLEEFHNGLTRKLIDHVEGTWTIRGSGIVAQIKIVVLGKQLADAVQDSESAIAAVKDTDRTGII